MHKTTTTQQAQRWRQGRPREAVIGPFLENRRMAKAVMIPQGNGLLRKPLYVWVARLALEVLIEGWPIHPVGSSGQGVFLPDQELARADMLVARGHDPSSAKNVDRYG